MNSGNYEEIFLAQDRFSKYDREHKKKMIKSYAQIRKVIQWKKT